MRLGTGLGSPEFLTINVLVALISVVILLSPGAKRLSVDYRLAERSPASHRSWSTAARVRTVAQPKS